jgi:quinol monooxygenase YgiN
MHIVHVHVRVKSSEVENFKKASIENAQNSIKESGIARFDVIQNQEDSEKFILVEVYRTIEDSAKHKETAHYQKWRDTVATMMAEPRASVKFTNIYPDDKGW